MYAEFIKKWVSVGCIGLLLALLSGPSQAREDTVLTLYGSGAGGAAGTVQQTWTLARLQALPQHSIRTRTPWDKGVVEFSGPLLRDVLAPLKGHGGTLLAEAINDYRVRIPLQDAWRHDVILAIRLQGEPIPLRSRGPLMIVYPFDSAEVLRSDTYYERAIWQLKSLRLD